MKIDPVVIKLYRWAYDAANQNMLSRDYLDAFPARLFIIELMYRNFDAYDSLCSDIAGNIIGG
jgi:hypothetical protein